MSIQVQKQEIGTCPACGAKDVPLREVLSVSVCERCASRKFSSKVRKRIEQIHERQQEEKRKEAWVKRIEVVKKGIHSYRDKKPIEALHAFQGYIMTLENRHGVGQGGLFPGLFTKTKDRGEVLIIAGVYWDMAKIYDRLKGHQTELRLCLNKYIEFSVNKNHNVFAAETIRKYLSSDAVVHKPDFKNAYDTLRGNMNRCFVASTVYGPDAPETEYLKRYRDRVLRKSSLGRSFIRVYYFLGPALARACKAFPRLHALARKGIGRFIGFLKRTHPF